MIVKTDADIEQLLKFIAENEVLAYDTETNGLNTRKDTVIGFGISSHDTSYYCPIFRFSGGEGLLSLDRDYSEVFKVLSTKKLLMFNASFDARITKSSLGVDLLPALHADVLLLKHTCDEEFPFGLKEIAAKLWGHDVKKEKEEMLASIKLNGGTAKEYFKASTELLARYCEQDCILTFKLYNHYSRQLAAEGLEKFYYEDEVLPLYKEVTIPMEEAGVTLDLEKLNRTLMDITMDIDALERDIQFTIYPQLGLFQSWFLNKDYPLQTATGKVPAWSKKYATQYEAWRAQNTGYMFNLQSKHHLKKLLFDTLGEKPLNKTPTGQPQADEELLTHIQDKHAWVKQLIEFNKLNKLKSTYLERFRDEAENGIFYPSFMQHRTVSGRYASDLQQLPRPISGDDRVSYYTSLIRELIIAPVGSTLVSADYEQLEPRVFAHTSGDPSLARIFNEGKDFYSEIAGSTEGLLSPTKEQRQDAKKYALGIAYGMTGYKLKFELGCTDEQADALVEKYLTAFPQLRSWMSESKKEAISKGFVRTENGRLRRLPRAKALYSKYGASITDSLRLWQTYNNTPAVYAQVKQDYRTFKNECNNAINVKVQGLAAGIVNRAAIAISYMIKNAKFKTKLVMQIHDELVYAVPNDEVESMTLFIKNLMETTTQLSVPLIVTPQSGINFRLCK